jgi:hypothetical protein
MPPGAAESRSTRPSCSPVPSCLPGGFGARAAGALAIRWHGTPSRLPAPPPRTRKCWSGGWGGEDLNLRPTDYETWTNSGKPVGRRNSDSGPDQAIPKLGLDSRPPCREQITWLSFSPDNVHETGVSPFDTLDCPSWPPRRSRSSKLQVRPGHEPNPSFCALQLGVSKQRADQLRREPDFPAPVDRWARGICERRRRSTVGADFRWGCKQRSSPARQRNGDLVVRDVVPGAFKDMESRTDPVGRVPSSG